MIEVAGKSKINSSEEINAAPMQADFSLNLWSGARIQILELFGYAGSGHKLLAQNVSELDTAFCFPIAQEPLDFLRKRDS